MKGKQAQTTQAEGHRIELVPVDQLLEAKRNPKRHSGEIGTSIGRFGYVEPIVVDERTGRIVAGHGRREALLGLKAKGAPAPAGVVAKGEDWLVPVMRGWASKDDAEAEAYLLASNKLVELGGWDNEALSAMLQDLGQADALEGIGFTSVEIDALLQASEAGKAAEGLTDPDEVPEVPKDADVYVKPGEVWVLGKHRIVCGDSTVPSTVERAMAGGLRAQCVWTDPPYGVSYKSKAGVIHNDDVRGLPELLKGAFAQCFAAMEDGAPIYISHPPGANMVAFLTAFIDAGFQMRQGLVWVKDSMVLGHADYHYKHEPILFGYKPGEGRRGRGGKGWYGDNSQVSVFEVPRPKRSSEHPTIKPVELVEKMLRNSTTLNGLVFEPFSGSGTTILTCEKIGRRCRAIELAPNYVQVAITRWEAFTGKKAAKEG